MLTDFLIKCTRCELPLNNTGETAGVWYLFCPECKSAINVRQAEVESGNLPPS